MKDESCNLVERMLVDFVEGELKEEDKIIVSKHLEKCDRCMFSYRFLLEMEKALISMKHELPPYSKTMDDVCMRLGIKRLGFLSRLVHSAVFPALIATLAGFLIIYLSNIPISGWLSRATESLLQSSGRFSRDILQITTKVFSRDIKVLIGINIFLVSFFAILWRQLVENFLRSTNGY